MLRISLAAFALLVPCLAAPVQAQHSFSDEARDALGEPGAEVTVGAWLDDAALGFDPRARLRARTAAVALTDAAGIDAAAAAHVAELGEALRTRITEPVAAAAQAAGLQVVFLGELLPVVYLRGEATALGGFLAARAEVRYVDVDRPAYKELDASVKSTRADRIWSLPIPFTGLGTKGCDIESGGISKINPWLPAGIVSQVTGSADSHSTAIGGIIASRHATSRGMAPDAQLLNANASSSESGIIAGAQWAFTNGADICNVSLWSNADSSGPITLGDMALDYLIRNLGRMIVKSAGNQGAGNIVTSPGRGWSCIAVGNMDDKGTATWKDDAMSSGSSTKDPANGAPKPEVAAPGSNITTTLTGSPWIGNAGSGTSFAAPHVVGGSLLLFEQLPALRTEPELLKALWIATAWHNVEGATALSDADGAGAIDAFAASSVLAAGRYVYGELVPDDFATGSKDVPVQLVAGNRARIAISWDSLAGAGPSYAPDVLNCKLNLQLIPPGGGAPIATATHPAAAWRIMELTPPVTGTYTLRLVPVSFLGASEPFGLAVSQVFDAHTNRISGVGDHPVGTLKSLTVSDAYHPGAGFVVLASASGGGYAGGLALTAYPRTIPIVADGMTWLGLQPNPIFIGFVGTLNGSGNANLSVQLPAKLSFVGATLTYSFVTVDPSAPDSVVEISPAYSSTIVP